jgi:hypothetical protein
MLPAKKLEENENMAKISNIQLLYFLEYYVRLFCKGVEFAQIPLPVKQKEALLVDFINFSGKLNRFDFSMHTLDLQEEFKKKNVPEALSKEDNYRAMKIAETYAENYIPQAIASIEENPHTNETNGIVLLSQEDVKNVIESFLEFTRNKFQST